MSQETTMGVLSRLKRRLAQVVGQNALFLNNTNLFSDLRVLFVEKNFSFNRKMYFELDRTSTYIMVKTFP